MRRGRNAYPGLDNGPRNEKGPSLAALLYFDLDRGAAFPLSLRLDLVGSSAGAFLDRVGRAVDGSWISFRRGT